VLRKVSCLAALLLVTLPAAPDAQQFGGARRVEVSSAYPYAAVGKWTCGDGGSRTVCTAFLAGSFQFETSDGQRFQVRNVRADHSDKSEAKLEEPDLDVAFGQIATRTGQPPPGEKYGRFAFDDADTVAASSGFTAHCSFGSATTRRVRGAAERSIPTSTCGDRCVVCFRPRRPATSSSCT
jgi:hypothetical protein